MPSVFISYRHESDAHRERVRGLAERLRLTGLDVIFDGFEEEKNLRMNPSNGWPLWSIQQASRADFVVIVGSQGWFRIVEVPTEPAESETGLGAAAEAECVVARMYKKRGNKFAVIVFFENVCRAEVPPFFEKCTRLDGGKAETVTRIAGWMNGVQPLPAPRNERRTRLNTIQGITWPKAAQFPKKALADRHEQREMLSDLVTGASLESVVCVVAASGTGKTKLLEVFRDVAETALNSVDGKVAYLKNLKEQQSPCGLLAKLCAALGGYQEFPQYARSIGSASPAAAQHVAWLDDLRQRRMASLIILDAWDDGTEELRSWIAGHLVPAVVQAPAMKLVIAGQARVEYPAQRRGAVRQSRLRSQIDREDWHDFVEARYRTHAKMLKQIVDHCISHARDINFIGYTLELMATGNLTS